MSKGINKVILLGHVGKDPDMRYTPGGLTIARLSLATSETWKDKQSGDRQERTEWHRVVFFGKLADIVGEYVKKGTLLYIEGSLKTSKYKDTKTGEDRYSTDINASVMQMLGGSKPSQNEDKEVARESDNAGYEEAFADDIPF